MNEAMKMPEHPVLPKTLAAAFYLQSQVIILELRFTQLARTILYGKN